MNQTIYDFEAADIKGKTIKLDSFKDKVLLIVNTASKCGFTPQYKGLQEIYDNYKDKNFVVLGFPCNQFGKQESGSEKEIEQFCEINFGVKFPLFSKIDVNGKNAHPLFNYLKDTLPGIAGTKAIKWNFTKFLIDKSGAPVKRFGSQDAPESITKDIEKLL